MQGSSPRKPRQSCSIASISVSRIPRKLTGKNHRRPRPNHHDLCLLGKLDRKRQPVTPSPSAGACSGIGSNIEMHRDFHSNRHGYAVQLCGAVFPLLYRIERRRDEQAMSRHELQLGDVTVGIDHAVHHNGPVDPRLSRQCGINRLHFSKDDWRSHSPANEIRSVVHDRPRRERDGNDTAHVSEIRPSTPPNWPPGTPPSTPPGTPATVCGTFGRFFTSAMCSGNHPRGIELVVGEQALRMPERVDN